MIAADHCEQPGALLVAVRFAFAGSHSVRCLRHLFHSHLQKHNTLCCVPNFESGPADVLGRYCFDTATLYVPPCAGWREGCCCDVCSRILDPVLLIAQISLQIVACGPSPPSLRLPTASLPRIHEHMNIACVCRC